MNILLGHEMKNFMTVITKGFRLDLRGRFGWGAIGYLGILLLQERLDRLVREPVFYRTAAEKNYVAKATPQAPPYMAGNLASEI